jgi:hypothetical protein
MTPLLGERHSSRGYRICQVHGFYTKESEQTPSNAIQQGNTVFAMFNPRRFNLEVLALILDAQYSIRVTH